MNVLKISIAKDFSEAPAGRYHPADGDFTGEKFRNEILIPALNKHDAVIVVFDNESGYGSSFIEEAFGGLVRVSGFKKSWLKDHLTFEATEDNATYIDEALGDIEVAIENNN